MLSTVSMLQIATLSNKACKIPTVSMLSTVSMLQIVTLSNKACKIATASMLLC